MKKIILLMALLSSTSIQPMKNIFKQNYPDCFKKNKITSTKYKALQEIFVKNSKWIQTTQKKYYCNISHSLSFEELKKTNLVFQEFLNTPFSNKNFDLFMEKNCDYNDLKSMSLVLHEIISLDNIEGFELFAPKIFKSFIINFINITSKKNKIPVEESIETLRMMINDLTVELNRKWPLIIFENFVKTLKYYK